LINFIYILLLFLFFYDIKKKHVQDLMKENKELQEKFNRCISVIREALLVSEESDNDNELLIQSLINENNGLKDMLQINKMNDISNIDLSSAETENKKKN